MAKDKRAKLKCRVGGWSSGSWRQETIGAVKDNLYTKTPKEPESCHAGEVVCRNPSAEQ